MQEPHRLGNSRKSFRKSQNIRYFITPDKALLLTLLLIFIVWLSCRGSVKAGAKEEPFFPIKYKQTNGTSGDSSYQQLVGNQKSIKEQIDHYCQDVKCHSQQLKILYLISQMINQQQVLEEYTIPHYPPVDEQTNLSEREILLPQVVQKEQDQPKNIQNLIGYTLRAVENEQLTTPLPRHTYLQALFDIFQTYSPYAGINCLFEDCSVLWQSQTRNALLTVEASQKIRPNLIEIAVQTDTTNKLQIVGLIMAPSNQLLGVHLGSFTLSPGTNWLHCKKSSCLQQYSMILFKLETMRISRLRIYRKMIL